MSTTIDQRVVEMRFDNSNFENNVKTSMTTLEKLKRALKFDGASKGLENIQSSANKVNFSGMSRGVDAMTQKFSYMQMTIQHQLNNIVDSAVNAGKRMVSALTIDPVKSGFQEYETQINAVQTILANTSHAGTTLDEVNNALDTLNTYADKTIYNFTEMTRNIGTFTAAGVDLQTSVESIQGIANLAAVSGSTSQQASTAMYQLSQALAAGKVSLMDWNSVVNAGMGGKVFQDALVRTSELLKTGAKDAIATSGSFRESLTKTGWLTTEVLTETLKQFAGAYSEADLISQGFTEKQAKEIAAMAVTAEDAATKVKTFTQLWDTLKEAAQSGWTQTWELIVGDFEEAKELLTGISDFIGNIINNSANRRNEILGGALKSNYSKLITEINEAGISTEKFQDKVRDLYDETHKEGAFDKLVERSGSFEKACKSGAISSDLLKNALGELNGKLVDLSGIQNNLKIGDKGEDVKKVQQALRELNYDLGDFGEDGVDGIVGNYTEAAIKAFQEAEGLEVTGIVDEETIAALEEATSSTGKLSGKVEELCDGVTELGGREKIIESLKNVWEGLMSVVRPIKMAFEKIFPKRPAEEYSEAIVSLIDKFKAFTEKLTINEETAAKIYRTFKGVFAVFDLVRTIAGGGLSLAFKLITKVLGALDIDILSVTANIGDLLVKFRDWLLQDNLITQSIDNLISKLPGAIDKIKEWWAGFKETGPVQSFLDAIQNIKEAFTNFTNGEISLDELASKLGTGIANALKSIPDMAMQIGKDVIEGFKNGIGSSGGDGISGVIDKIISFCSNFISAFMDALGVHSPSVKAFAIGAFVILGFINGLKSLFPSAFEALKGLGSDLLASIKEMAGPLGDELVSIFQGIFDFLSDENGKIQWDKIFAIITSVTAAIFGKKVLNIFENLTDPLGGLGDILSNAAETVSTFNDKLPKLMKSFSKMTKGLGKMFKGIGFEHKTEGIKNLAVAILILVGAVAVITMLDPTKLRQAVGVILALSVILAGLVIAVSKLSDTSLEFGKTEKGFGGSVKGLKISLAQIAAAILMVAVAAKIVGGMNQDEILQGLGGVAAIAVGLFGVAAAIGFLTKGDLGKNADKVGKMMTKLAFAMLLMIGVIKLSGTINEDEAIKAGIFAVAFGVFVMAITHVAKSAGNNVGKVGGMILKISIAMALMVGVVKLISLLSPEEMIKGGAFALVFAVFVRILVQATKIGKRQQIANLTGLLLSVSVAMAIMGGICKLLGSMSLWGLAKGVAAIAVFTLLIKGLINTVKDMKSETPKLAGTLLAFAGAIAILAGVTFLLGQMDPLELLQGLAAVVILSVMISALVEATKEARDVKGTIVAIAVTVAVMAASIAALSMLKPTSLIAPTIALGVLMGMFALIAKSSKDVTKSVGPLIVMTAAIGVIATALGILSSLDPMSLIAPTIALGVVMGMFAVMLKSLSSTDIKIKPLIVITAVIGVLGGILYLLRGLDPTSAISAVGGIVILLTALIVAMKSIKETDRLGVGSIIGLVAMTAIIAVLGLVIAQLKDVDPKSAIGGAAAIAILLASLVGVLYLCSGIGDVAGQALLGAVVLAAFIALLGVAVWACAKLAMNVIADMPEMAKNLSDFMTNLKPFLDGASNIPDGLLGKLASLAAGMAVLGLGEFVLSLTNLLSNLLGSSMQSLASELSGFMTNLAPFLIGSMLIPDGIAGKLALLSAGMVAIGIGQFATAVTNLLTKLLGSSMPSLATELSGFMTNLTPFLIGSMLIPDGIAGKLGSLSAGMVAIGIGQFATAVTNLLSKLLGSSMPSLASELSGFMMNLLPFLIGSMLIPDGLAGKLRSLSSGIVALGIGNGLTAFTNLISNVMGQGLPTLGSDLGGFMTNVMPFIAGVSQIPDDISTKVGLLTSAIGDLTTENFWKSIKEFFSGGDNASLANLGSELTTLGEGMAAFSTSANSFSTSSESISAITSFIEDVSSFDTSDTGNIWNLSDSISDIATAIGEFSDITSKMDTSGIDTAITAAGRIKTLIASISDLDTSGVSEFTGIGIGAGHGGGGADGIATDIAKTMKEFSDKVADIDVSAVSTASTAALKIKNLIAGLSGLDTSGVENFKPAAIGSAMKSYSDKVKGLNSGSVSSSISIARRLKTFITELSGLDTSGVSKFKPASIGSALKTYNTNVSGIDLGTIISSITAGTKMKNFISGLSGLDTSGVSSFKSAVSNLAKVNISDAAKSLNKTANLSSSGTKMMTSLSQGVTSSSSKVNSAMTSTISNMLSKINSQVSSFTSAGAKLVTGLASGIKSRSALASSAASSAASNGATGARSYWNSYYRAGTYLGDGLISGINAKKQEAYNAGYQLGRRAAQGVADGSDEESPSKLTIQYGKYLGEGLIIGINKTVRSVYNTSEDLGKTAAGAITSTVAKIADVISSGIDTQPTIRPVLDLSDIESGVGTMSSMLDMNSSVGVMSNVSAISSMMSQRNQNGANDDIVSAINKLSKKLDNVGGDTYSIGGITYDDGSNISEAVKSIVRAARVERRI